MIKKVAIILVSILFIFIVAVGLTMVILGQDSAPPDISDLAMEDNRIPESQNAFPHLMEAANEIQLPPDTNMIIDYIQGKQLYDSIMAETVNKNISVFPLIENALQFEHCQPTDPENLAYIQNYYRIGLLLAIRMIHERQANQLSDSIRTGITLLQFSDKIHPDALRLADFDPCFKMLRLAVEESVITAKLQDTPTEDLQFLADTLSSFHPFDRGLKTAFQYKFQSVVHEVDHFRQSGKNLEQTFADLASSRYPLRKIKWFPGYMLKENETKSKMAEMYRDTIQNVSKNYSEMKLYDLTKFFGLEGHGLRVLFKPNLVGRFFYALRTPEVSTYLETKCQMEGFLRAGQLIVALQMYQREYNKLPEALSELVPKYLSRLPLDPYNGELFHYLPEKEIIYSVSKDLKDSGGSVEIPEGEIYGPEYPRTWITEDGVFEIN